VGTSTVIKTAHTMIALLYSLTAMSVFDFGLAARRPTAATLSETIWRLHYIIVKWDSKSDDVKTEKRQLLRVLETNKLPRINLPKLLL
jgi:hypothetical protein